MKKLLLASTFFFSLTVAHGQTDSIKTQEISLGISIIPPLYPGFGHSMSGTMPGIRLNRIEKADQYQPALYSIPINVNYRFKNKKKGKNNLSFIAVIPINSSSDLSYYAISYGKTLAKLNKKGTFSLNGNLLLGYLKYNEWALGGHFIYPKWYKGADLLITGFNIGFTAHYKLSSRLFLENEIYFLTYYAGGTLYYYTGSYLPSIGTSAGSKIGITVSKFLAFNLGYKF
jgi:hypothetical protein